VFSAVLLACAVGLWRAWYGAVLGFMALLAIIATAFALLLIEASNLLGFFVAPIVDLAPAGCVFKLVRVLRPDPDAAAPCELTGGPRASG